MSEKYLKSCPHCGGLAAMDDWKEPDGKWYSVSCIECGASGPQEMDEDRAAELWNRRV